MDKLEHLPLPEFKADLERKKVVVAADIHSPRADPKETIHKLKLEKLRQYHITFPS